MRMIMQADVTGLTATGRADPVLARAARAAEDATVRYALDEVHAELEIVLQHPSGYYQSHVRADYGRRPPSVHDDRVVYGPWLEGVGSRNATTRFKGYETFRRVAQRVQGDVVRVTAPVLDDAVQRLNT